MSTTTAIALVSRDPHRARAWRLAIEADGRYQVVTVVGSGQQLLHVIDDVGVDVVVSELQLADGDATGMVRTLRHGNKPKYLDLMVLLIAPVAEHPVLIECLREGADSYYIDTGNPPTLGSRLDEMITGEAKMSAHIAKQVMGHFLSRPYDPNERMGGRPNPEQLLNPFTLTPNERAVLLRLATGQTVPEIAQMEKLSMHHVAKCIRSMYRKMELELRADRLTLV